MSPMTGKKKPRTMPHRPAGTKRRRNSVRTEPKQKPLTPAIPEPMPAEAVKEVRMRLDTNDRRLLVAGLLQLLPKKLGEDRHAWHELDWEAQRPYRAVRELLERLRDARRGHPSTWGF